MREISVPVLIVGGGGCGLATALFLSRLGVKSLLVERHATVSPMPKARGLNRRTLEIARQFGFEEDIRQGAMPGAYATRIRWMTSLGGEDELARKTLFEIDSFGGGDAAQEYEASSPFGKILVYPQVRLEPMLREKVKGMGVGDLRLNTELVAFEQSADDVVAEILDRGTGEKTRVRARYMVAADAGRTVGPAVGARFEGTAVLRKMITVYFRADLSAYFDDDHLSTTIFVNPGGETAFWGSGALGKIGPPWDRRCREWLLHSAMRPDDPDVFDDRTIIDRIRELLKIPDLDVEVLGSAPWTAQGLLVNQYRFGRVFLAGDAAHRHPPATGLGLNSGIQDAHNLAWKLALVLRSEAGDALLDSYESERRPVARRNVRWALFAFSNAQLTAPALGVIPGNPEESRANILALLADDDEGRARKRRLEQVMRVNRTEFQANDLEVGFAYERGAIVADGTAMPERDPEGFRYIATTRPGHRLPHAWIGRQGALISTLDLVSPDRFTLIVGQPDSPWVAAARTLAPDFDAVLEIVSVGDSGEVIDRDHVWRRHRELADSGALLVRPDQHVAWRAFDFSPNAATDLRSALTRILGRATGLDRPILQSTGIPS